jgi:hypothetical protein
MTNASLTGIGHVRQAFVEENVLSREHRADHDFRLV